jgi:hypothetical protein
VAAGRLQALAAEVARAIGPGERHDDQVTPADRGDIGTDVLDDADALMPDSFGLLGQ